MQSRVITRAAWGRIDHVVMTGAVVIHAMFDRPPMTVFIACVVLWWLCRQQRLAARAVAQQSALHERCKALETCIDACATVAETATQSDALRERLFDLPQ